MGAQNPPKSMTWVAVYSLLIIFNVMRRGVVISFSSSCCLNFVGRMRESFLRNPTSLFLFSGLNSIDQRDPSKLVYNAIPHYSLRSYKRRTITDQRLSATHSLNEKGGICRAVEMEGMISKTLDDIRPVFVLGCPRSGTTLIGEFISTSPELLNIGELSAMYFASRVAEREYARVPSQYKREYLKDLCAHSASFLRTLCVSEGKPSFLESTPWNIRVLPVLVQAFPNALFVVCIRHYAGVILSMRSSWEQGYKWAGPTDTDRAQLWSEMNGYIDQLPIGRTIAFSYDDMCKEPGAAITNLEEQLLAQGVMGPFDRSIFAISHASSSARPKVSEKRTDGGEDLRSISAYDRSDWSAMDDLAVRDIVAPAIEEIAMKTGINISLAHTTDTWAKQKTKRGEESKRCRVILKEFTQRVKSEAEI